MRRPWPTGGRYAMEGEEIIKLLYITNIILYTAAIRRVVIQSDISVTKVTP
jgi:hypothetical protein